jgi:cysteine desulfurase
MVLRGFAHERTLLVSSIEHASIGKTASLLGGATIPVDSNGVVKLDMLEQMLADLGSHALVSVMLANNETGVIQPIAEIAKIAHGHSALVHCDAVQALGKIPLDWGLLGVDMLTIAAHKAGGPVGAGALLIRSDLPIKPLITGGAQELGRRAGTMYVSAIVGFAQMVKEMAACPDAAKWLEWREWLAVDLCAAAPNAVVIGLNAPRLPNTLNITMPGVKAETQMMNFDLAGFAISAGSACSSGKMAASSTLLAMGIAPEIAECALRISWGWGTTRAEMEAFAAAWKAMAARLVRRAA